LPVVVVGVFAILVADEHAPVERHAAPAP